VVANGDKQRQTVASILVGAMLARLVTPTSRARLVAADATD
jgi:hypothetical protein